MPVLIFAAALSQNTQSLTRTVHTEQRSHSPTLLL